MWFAIIQRDTSDTELHGPFPDHDTAHRYASAAKKAYDGDPDFGVEVVQAEPPQKEWL